MMAENIKFVAKLSGVKEVSLLGTARFDYWQDVLRPHGLSPVPLDGEAQIIVVAAKARFKGVLYSEVGFSIVVSPNQKRHTLRDAVCLLRAYNSNRFFAFIERNVFATPYRYGKCEIELDPIGVRVSIRGETLFSVQMGSVSHRERSQMDNDGWYGTIAIIPPKGLANKYFVAKIDGPTTNYSFDGACDTLTFAKGSGIPILTQLAESGFHGKQWIIRPSANHAKSKTYRSDPPT